jgi:hypothetical protein
MLCIESPVSIELNLILKNTVTVIPSSNARSKNSSIQTTFPNIVNHPHLPLGLELAISPYRPLSLVVSYACSTLVCDSSACEKA